MIGLFHLCKGEASLAREKLAPFNIDLWSFIAMSYDA